MDKYLNKYGILYCHVVEPRMETLEEKSESQRSLNPMRKAFKGTFIVAGGYEREDGNRAVAEDHADLIAYARCVMEVKPTHGRRHLSLSLPKFSPDCFPFRRSCLSSWVSNSIWDKKHFRGIVLRWSYQIQEIAKGQSSTKYVLVHAVKEGETLTSIAKHYGVSIYSIAAANRNIVDLDFVLQGQLLNIPCSSPQEAQVFGTVKRWLHSIKVPKRLEGSLNSDDGLANPNMFTVLTTNCGFPHAKTAGYLVVLVPVIILCIRCIMGAFRNKVAEDLKQETLNNSKRPPPEAKSSRWRSALSDIWDIDISDSQPSFISHNPSDDQSETPFEDMSRDYSKLERDYQKFLAECGMGERGYWRGGSSE